MSLLLVLMGCQTDVAAPSPSPSLTTTSQASHPTLRHPFRITFEHPGATSRQTDHDDHIEIQWPNDQLTHRFALYWPDVDPDGMAWSERPLHTGPVEWTDEPDTLRMSVSIHSDRFEVVCSKTGPDPVAMCTEVLSAVRVERLVAEGGG
jgi:hypothetical protein